MKKKKLRISTPTEERMLDMLKKSFFSESITLKLVCLNTYEIYNSKGKMTDFIVLKEKNRFRCYEIMGEK